MVLMNEIYAVDETLPPPRDKKNATSIEAIHNIVDVLFAKPQPRVSSLSWSI
jgi:hypothetical protein